MRLHSAEGFCLGLTDAYRGLGQACAWPDENTSGSSARQLVGHIKLPTSCSLPAACAMLAIAQLAWTLMISPWLCTLRSAVCTTTMYLQVGGRGGGAG